MAGLKGMMGRKLGMTRVFAEDGRAVPVTVIEVGPCTVLQKKTEAREGYNALQLGFGRRSKRRLTRPVAGHLKKAGVEEAFAFIREVRVDDPGAFEVGQVLTLADLDLRELVDVTGQSKGRGYAGVVRRWGFHRGPMGHGSKHHRAIGSAGMSATPSRVLKGKRMPGRLGGDRRTVRNLLVVDTRPEENLLLVRGSVPGAVNQLVTVKCK
ncbi:50S ribosomal protein L3 [Dissulfurirhabdus thermomarina]|uniref:Large ribosomal subunit protein uL3 n=1 Tax=Dissulfurirhabdus thermomarina TaxID=1765737 RepID=A0A6N9TJQ1_DISTH|nr:50S ribosomal protein L3 [Dissulfurirhabdus thermomarina]NDY41308.1 50S ribosomal protein L3 [Dissulfurirhabdus thermomarina]NMX23309.1 50S ribosomal protein L3 [Dissulfurirhabdus thermomarina]